MSDGMWVYAWWPLLLQRLEDDQIEDRHTGYLAGLAHDQARRTVMNFKSFVQCVATAGALMAAEDRGYKSGYRTGYGHVPKETKKAYDQGWNDAMTKAHWASWDIS